MALAYFDSSDLIAQSGSTLSTHRDGHESGAGVYGVPYAGTAARQSLWWPTPRARAPSSRRIHGVEIKGTNLAPTGDTRIWAGSHFFGNQMPATWTDVGVTVNGKQRLVYFVSPTQVNILTPPDVLLGAVKVQRQRRRSAECPGNACSRSRSRRRSSSSMVDRT